MRKEKKQRLEKAGWRVAGAKEFLGLNDAESAVVEIRVALARTLRSRRLERHMSQAALAKHLGSSQSRVAKMEAGDPSVTIDLLLRSLVVAGSTPADIGKAISTAHAA